MFGIDKKEILYSAILNASENNIESYINEIKDNIELLNSDNEEKINQKMLSMRKNYMDKVYNSVIDAMKIASPKIYSKIQFITNNPSVCGYPDIDISNGIMAGSIYAICYYALTDKVAEPVDCIELNHLQDDIINKAMHKLDDELVEIEQEENQVEKESNVEGQKEINKTWKDGIVNYSKEDLMTTNELKVFAVANITPYILKDLNVDEKAIMQNNTQAPIEYLIKTPEGIVGVEFIVDIAPNKTAVLYNEISAKEMHELGFKYAVARIGIGAADSLRFDRRIVLKNDAYNFDYQGIKILQYIDKANVRYSLSEDVSWKQIYKRMEQGTNPYAVQKTVANYKSIFKSETYNEEIKKMMDTYKVEQMHQKSLANYLQVISESIAYRLTIKDILVNFLNCVDYCKGLFLADSQIVSKSKIIKEVIELLETNILIDLDKHSIFCFAYYIYHYITEGVFNSEKLTLEEANRLRIALFERKPEMFGYPEIAEKIERSQKINSDENLAQMQEDIQIFANDIYKEFIKLNMEINENVAKRPINFKVVSEIMTEKLLHCRKLLSFVEEGFNPNELKKKLDIYNKYKKALKSFIVLLELEVAMDKKLYNKSTGGRYGFWEYRKDSKQRNEQCNLTIALMDDLINNFQIKTFPRETNLMIENCKKLFIEFKDKYKKCIEKETGYTELKKELCGFYEYFLTMPYEKDATEFRKGVLLTITDFIEVIEYRENSANENMLEQAEENLFANLKDIREKIYNIIV